MNPLLISGFGTSINVDKAKLIINNKLKKEKLEFFPHKIDHDSIIIDGHTGYITFESLRWLSKHDIQITLLNWNGNLLSVTLPDSPNSGKLRIKQYQKYQDDIIRYTIAESIVFSKIDSSINLLKELSKFYDIKIKDIENNIEKEYSNYLSQEKSLSHLLTFEGRIAQNYFDALRVIFAKLAPEFNFQGRKVKENNRNYNAADEINALLNYGYAILVSEIKKIVNNYGLDSEIGFLHEITQSRTPLVYDIQELFRWIVDLSVIQVLESGKLKKSNFILTENYNIRLKENTAKLLISKIKDNFRIKMPYKGKNFYYENILADNVSKLSLFISEKNKNISFDIPNISLKRNDVLDIQDKILKMTPEDRKKLGINKSTLFYMKKNIKEGKNIKIYDKVLTKIKD